MPICFLIIFYRSVCKICLVPTFPNKMLQFLSFQDYLLYFTFIYPLHHLLNNFWSSSQFLEDKRDHPFNDLVIIVFWIRHSILNLFSFHKTENIKYFMSCTQFTPHTIQCNYPFLPFAPPSGMQVHLRDGLEIIFFTFCMKL